MKSSKLDRIIKIVKEEMTATGGNLAGLPPDQPPVKKKKDIYIVKILERCG
jgi:hypothetical protein